MQTSICFGCNANYKLGLGLNGLGRSWTWKRLDLEEVGLGKDYST